MAMVWNLSTSLWFIRVSFLDVLKLHVLFNISKTPEALRRVLSDVRRGYLHLGCRGSLSYTLVYPCIPPPPLAAYLQPLTCGFTDGRLLPGGLVRNTISSISSNQGRPETLFPCIPTV